jgi:hypothetical protein
MLMGALGIKMAAGRKMRSPVIIGIRKARIIESSPSTTAIINEGSIRKVTPPMITARRRIMVILFTLPSPF